MEIKPTIGLGRVTFDFSPIEVNALMGKPTHRDMLVDEALAYGHLAFHFDKSDASGPLPDAKMEMISISEGYPARLFGEDPFTMTGKALQELLSHNGIESKWYDKQKELLSATGCLEVRFDMETELPTEIELYPASTTLSYEKRDAYYSRPKPPKAWSPLQFIRRLLGAS